MVREREGIEREQQVENLCRWAAARAGVIVLTPGIGTMALVANEVYLIMRIGKLYGKQISQSAAIGFLASLGAAFAGKTLATLLPFPPVQITVGVSLTYAVGKAAQAWLEAGMPSQLGNVRSVFERARQEAKCQWKKLSSHPDQQVPLGDETVEIPLLPVAENKTSQAGEPEPGRNKGRDRLETIARLQEEVGRRIERLPLGGEIVGPALDYIFNDPQVKQVMEAIQHPRPLRIVFVGRTGAGKSSLINALAGK